MHSHLTPEESSRLAYAAGDTELADLHWRIAELTHELTEAQRERQALADALALAEARIDTLTDTLDAAQAQHDHLTDGDDPC